MTLTMPRSFVPNREQRLVTHLWQGIALAIVLTVGSYLIGLQFGWISTINWLEAFAVATSYLCTFLCVMERRWNYPVGVISTAAYCILFYQWGLYASMAINAYLVFTLIYGWFRWRDDSNTRPVTRLDWRWLPVYLCVIGVAYLGILAIANAFGAVLATTDSFILVGTLLAQFLLDNKKIETWAVWAVVNIFAIYTYANAGLTLAAFQYVFFLINTVYGYIMWKRSKDASPEEDSR